MVLANATFTNPSATKTLGAGSVSVPWQKPVIWLLWKAPVPRYILQSAISLVCVN